jgi:hypothetical protein
MKEELEEMVDDTAIGAVLKVKRRVVQEMTREKRIPCYWTNSHHPRYRVSEVLAAIKGNQEAEGED